MSKRLTDTDIWKKRWFFDLPDKMKLFWFYILSDCDSAGIWTVNFKILDAYLGKYEPEKVIDLLKDQVIIIDENYWIIRDFIKFQYGWPLKENSPMFKKVDTLLSQRNLSLDTLYDTVSVEYAILFKNKNKIKNKDKEEEKEESEEEKLLFYWIGSNCPKLLQMKQPITFDGHIKLSEKYGRKEVTKIYLAMENKPDLIKKYDSAYLTALNWLKRDNPSL
jgi:hypothetical protein